MKHLPINAQLFVENRKRFVKEMSSNSIAVFNSNDEVPQNGDAFYKFAQNNDLYWLSGIEQEDTMVVLYPDCPNPKYREVLVLARPNEMYEKWYGRRLREAEAVAISGIKTIVWLDALDPLLMAWFHSADAIYLNTNEHDRKGSGWLETRDYRFARETVERYPAHQFKRSAKIMHKLRGIKSKHEVEVMQVAMDITEKTFRRLLGFIKPGVMEYEIEAEIMHEFLRNRASGEAYNSIIASGDNARILHYIANSEECKDGDLILMDFGARYGGYNADLTRTIPVNGKFTKRQKEVYNACLHLHKYAASILKPGLSVLAYTDKVQIEANKAFEKIGLLTKADIKNEDKENRACRKYFYHGLSHHLGVGVHDLGTFTQPIQAGMMFTIEPGIYIEEEKMGIRIENNFWVTKNGNIDLMKNIPITVEDIEKLMKRK